MIDLSVILVRIGGMKHDALGLRLDLLCSIGRGLSLSYFAYSRYKIFHGSGRIKKIFGNC